MTILADFPGLQKVMASSNITDKEIDEHTAHQISGILGYKGKITCFNLHETFMDLEKQAIQHYK